MIRCARCNFSNGAIVGTAREREFHRVMDTVSGRCESAYKDFYCSTKCYSEHVFLKFVCARLRINWREIQYFDIQTQTTSDPELQRMLPYYVDRFYTSVVANVK